MDAGLGAVEDEEAEVKEWKLVNHVQVVDYSSVRYQHEHSHPLQRHLHDGRSAHVHELFQKADVFRMISCSCHGFVEEKSGTTKQKRAKPRDDEECYPMEIVDLIKVELSESQAASDEGAARMPSVVACLKWSDPSLVEGC